MKLAAASLLLAAGANAQVSTVGHPSFGMTKTQNAFSQSPFSLLPALNSTKVMAWREAQGHGEKNGGFAVPQTVSINAAKDGDWVDGVWRYTFKATDEVTKGMYVMFDQFVLPEGATLFAYTDEGVVAGAFTSANNKENKGFMIRPLQGKTITIEYNANDATEEPELAINVVGSAYANFPGYKSEEKRGPSGWCNVNSACSDADEWRDEIDAGAILMGGFSGGYCSGSMINNEEGKQYFLTAFHCRPSANDVVGFNFAEETCDGNSNNIQPDTAQGLTTIASSSGSDFHLMEVNEAIPSSYGVYLAGWNAEEKESWSSPITGIHHPSADRQKFSQYYGDVTRSGYITSNGVSHWYVQRWDLGTTEGGSSGSPLYNADKQIIGQLHGGYASCTYNVDDYYGSTAVSYVNGLGPALAPSGAMSMSGTAL